ELAERAAAAIARGPVDVPVDAAVVGGLAAGVGTIMTAATGFTMAAGVPPACACDDASPCAVVLLDDLSLDLLSSEALPSLVCAADCFDVSPLAADAAEPTLRLVVCLSPAPACDELADGGPAWSSEVASRGAGLSSGDGGPAESCEAGGSGGEGGALTMSGKLLLSIRAPKLSLGGAGSGRAGLMGAFPWDALAATSDVTLNTAGLL
ncbi:MAG: hypothetical protein ACREDC_08470, partial [Bradyrhizobium sp.]